VLQRIKDAAAIVHVPRGWHVVLYFVGHGQRTTGNWLVFDDAHQRTILNYAHKYQQSLDEWAALIRAKAAEWMTGVSLDDVLHA
jgi:hypothetical protein